MENWKRSARVLVLASAVSLTASCGSDDSAHELVELGPVAITDQEGAVCGMLIREQSAPRAQVVHRDGERAFLCGVGDLLAYLDAPSPHGAAVSVQVEVMQPGQQPVDSHTGPHPWIAAEQGVYVVGIERKRIMGPPVLVYRDRAAAEQVATVPSAKILTWDELRPWWKSQQERGGAAH